MLRERIIKLNAGRATYFSLGSQAARKTPAAVETCSAIRPFRSRRTTPLKARMRMRVAIDWTAQKMAKNGAPIACQKLFLFALATCRSSIFWHAVLPSPHRPLPALVRPLTWEYAPLKVAAFRASRARLEIWSKYLVRPPARKIRDPHRICSLHHAYSDLHVQSLF